jgi:hypothetical protein
MRILACVTYVRAGGGCRAGKIAREKSATSPMVISIWLERSRIRGESIDRRLTPGDVFIYRREEVFLSFFFFF